MALKNVEMKSSEILQKLNYMYNNNLKLQEMGITPIAMQIEGHAGLGKTSLVRQFCNDHDLQFVKINLSMLDELSDLVGFPIKQHLMCKKTVQRKDLFSYVDESDDTIWVNESATSQFVNNGYIFTGETRTTYAPPEWIANKGDNGILLLDDWNRADQRFIQACMELINEQTYYSWKLPKGWTIVLTSNPDDGTYMVNEMDDAVKSRFITFDMRFDINDWMKWAEAIGISDTCINFLALNPDIIGKDKSINPRSMSMFFNSIRSIDDFQKTENLSTMQLLAQASVGPEVASMFTAFVHNKLDKLITPKEVIEMDFDKMCEKFKGSTGKDDNYRADIASIIARRTVNYMREYVKTNKLNDKIMTRIKDIIKSDLLTNDLIYMFASDMYDIDNNKFKPMILDVKVAQIIMKR